MRSLHPKFFSFPAAPSLVMPIFYLWPDYLFPILRIRMVKSIKRSRTRELPQILDKPSWRNCRFVWDNSKVVSRSVHHWKNIKAVDDTTLQVTDTKASPEPSGSSCAIKR